MMVHAAVHYDQSFTSGCGTWIFQRPDLFEREGVLNYTPELVRQNRRSCGPTPYRVVVPTPLFRVSSPPTLGCYTDTQIVGFHSPYFCTLPAVTGRHGEARCYTACTACLVPDGGILVHAAAPQEGVWGPSDLSKRAVRDSDTICLWWFSVYFFVGCGLDLLVLIYLVMLVELLGKLGV